MLERNLGFKLTHHTLGANRTQDEMRKNNFHLANISFGGAQTPLDHAARVTLISTANNNASLWADPQLDQLFDKQWQTVDPVERKKLLHEAQRYVMQERNLPVAPNVRNFDFFASATRVKAWDGRGVYFLGIAEWQFGGTWVTS